MIHVNTILTVQATGSEPGTDYVCQVVGHSQMGLVFTVPQVQGRFQPLVTGTEITCYYAEPDKFVDFKTRVLGYTQTNPPGMIVAEPQSIRKRNRRAALRFPVELQVSYMVDGDRITLQKTRTIDLSHTGLLMRTPRLLKYGANLTLMLELPNFTLKADGVVRRSFKGGMVLTGGVILTGVEFMENRPTEAQQLHQFLVGLERERAKAEASASR